MRGCPRGKMFEIRVENPEFWAILGEKVVRPNPDRLQRPWPVNTVFPRLIDPVFCFLKRVGPPVSYLGMVHYLSTVHYIFIGTSLEMVTPTISSDVPMKI